MPQQQEDAWTQATNNITLTEGSKIKTDTNGGTLKLADTTTLNLEPNTLIQIQLLSESNNILLLQTGEFTANVKNLPANTTLSVEMSQAVAKITGTIFTVKETGTDSTLSVQEGSVSFTSKVDGKTVNVEAGQKVTATSAGLGTTLTETKTQELSPYAAIAAVVLIVIIVSVSIAVFKTKRKKRHIP
jgi:ferric-dicitrate binding protein FerR (iron transport regulator)